MEHTWIPHANPRYIALAGRGNALVRIAPMPDGRYLWQFRDVVSYASTLEAAKDYVEAGAEFFDAMRRNPYAT